MNYISFDRPDNMERLEAVSKLNRALFELGKVYGLDNPFQLIESSRSSLQYDLSRLVDEQTNKPDGKDKSDDDSSINLDDIPL